MQVDWFTVVAQVLNFLVLVALLRRFLYGPIIHAMDQREQRISGRMSEAERREREAEEEARAFEEQRNTLESERKDVLDRAAEEAAERKLEMIEAARRDVDQMRSHWRQALQREKDAFLADIRRKAGEQICEVTRRMMRDLATVELQAQLTDVFLKRLHERDWENWHDFREEVVDGKAPLVVTTAFELEGEVRERISASLQRLFAQSQNPVFQTADDLICGIEVRSGGRRIAWNVSDYLDGLEESLLRILDHEVGDTNGT